MEGSFVPLISSSQTGSLGFAHLPRLWLKMRAHDAGVLAPAYRHGAGGMDEMLLKTLGIELDPFSRFIAGQPDYPACEDWIRAQAADCSSATARTFTEMIVTFVMPDPRRSEWMQRFGLTGAPPKAVVLNQLDDWDGVHAHLLAGGSAAPLVPAIGSNVAGLLGAVHLPRMWLKQRLHAAGRLPEGYRLGRGFDAIVSDTLDFDPDAFAGYVHSATPDYPAAEAWVREHARALAPAAIGELNAAIRTYASTSRPGERSAAVNDLDDWGALDRELKAIAIA